MKLLLVIVLLFSLFGCNVFHEKPLPPSEATDVQLQIAWVESQADLPKTSRADINGTAVWFDIGDQRYCTVYMVKPYGLNDFVGLQTLGHEILHCTEGSFHNPMFDKNEIQELRDMMN